MLQLPKSTTEILALKVLGETTNERWVAWAVEMLMAGFDGEHLVQLAGESPPYNSWEMDALTNKVLAEQNLPYANRKAVIEDYVCALIEEALAGKQDLYKTLRKLKDLGDAEGTLDSEFANLYWAKEDLLELEVQWYWPGATRENIDAIIVDFFRERKADCRQGLSIPLVKPL